MIVLLIKLNWIDWLIIKLINHIYIYLYQKKTTTEKKIDRKKTIKIIIINVITQPKQKKRMSTKQKKNSHLIFEIIEKIDLKEVHFSSFQMSKWWWFWLKIESNSNHIRIFECFLSLTILTQKWYIFILWINNLNENSRIKFIF